MGSWQLFTEVGSCGRGSYLGGRSKVYFGDVDLGDDFGTFRKIFQVGEWI